MYLSPSSRRVIWAVVLLSPLAAWYLTSFTWQILQPRVGVFFTAAACLAAAGGLLPALVAAGFNTLALNLFSFSHRSFHFENNLLWSLLLITVAASIGYACEKWRTAEIHTGRLSSDLARLRDELSSQRADLKRFHELSVRLSSNLELQRLLNDVLQAIAGLMKTDLAMLLRLPNAASKTLRVEAHTGFTADQINLFGELPSSFFSLQKRVLIEDIEIPGTYFPFVDAASKAGFRALLSLPIINNKREPLGVVVTFFRNAYVPSDRQLRLVELYARQAANALDNARTYRASLETLAAEQHRTAILRALAEASVQMNSALSLDSVLQVITDQARIIIGARQALTTYVPKGSWSQTISCSSAEDQRTLDSSPPNLELFALACRLNKPIRISGQAGSQNRPWLAVNPSSKSTAEGWLAAPLVTRDGRNLGLIQLSQKITGEFSEDDESILVQLAQMASVAIENVRLYREAQEQIAETKRTQEALHISKESINLAQRCAGIAIWEWDLHSGKLAWSDETFRLHGIQPELFDGQYESWIHTIHSEDRLLVHNAITNALAEGGEYQVQYRVLFPDKSVHWLEARGQTILLGNSPVRMLGAAIDITARKAAEETLRTSEKLAATGRLAASMAHEINNPLAALTNLLYLLHASEHLPPAEQAYVNTAQAELSRVTHITQQTLAFYRESASPAMTYIPDLLDETLTVYNTRIEQQKIRVNKRYSNVEKLLAFAGELRQVFSNLLLNALEAVSASGEIAVRVRQAHGSNGAGGVRVTIADNGPGIAPKHLPMIFEPFFTTKDSKGTGLGLWVSHAIIQKHGGSIRVKSRIQGLQRGTCFTVFLPFASDGNTKKSQWFETAA